MRQIISSLVISHPIVLRSDFTLGEPSGSYGLPVYIYTRTEPLDCEYLLGSRQNEALQIASSPSPHLECTSLSLSTGLQTPLHLQSNDATQAFPACAFHSQSEISKPFQKWNVSANLQRRCMVWRTAEETDLVEFRSTCPCRRCAPRLARWTMLRATHLRSQICAEGAWVIPRKHGGVSC